MNSLVNRIGEKLDKGYVKDEDKYSQQGMEEYSSEARGKLDESV